MLKQLSTKPLTLDPNERYAELIKLKRKLINDSKRSPFYFENINPDRSDFNSTIQRYSDRYLKQKRVDSAKWNIGKSKNNSRSWQHRII